jgi:alpha/beta hydrolase family protein
MSGFGASRWWVAVALGALVVSSCSSGANNAAPNGASTSAPRVAGFTVRLPVISPPPAAGKGIDIPQPAPQLPTGYVQDELFVSGTATSFDAVDTPNDGRWTATPGKTAKYRTRVIVRRPPAAKFSGTVLVEWFNVSALESAPDWAYLSPEIGREGDAYIGVSAQAQGVEGGKTILNANVDQKKASSLGVSTDKSGLKHIDPARYGTLVHPGDAYSYDIFSQVGRAAGASPSELLGGLQAKRVLAIGESQSAAFLTTFVDAIHPIAPVFNGFLIHSRGAGAIPLDGKVNDSSITRGGVLIRTDLDVPVFLFETETDLMLLGYADARQPDSKFVHTWEVAGTSHVDAYLIRAVIGGPRDPNVGSFLGCNHPVNVGPQHEVLQAAFRQFDRWAAGGAPPATGARMELLPQKAGKDPVIARDANGIALGGVRNPLVDVPVVTTTGELPKGVNNEICALFGQTIPYDRAKLVDLYGNADNYVAKFRASADKEVAAGFLLRPDADALIAEAEANRALFG